MNDRVAVPEPANPAYASVNRSGRVAFGTAVLSTASITKLLLQCVLIPVLARVLGPGIFGEMSIAMSFVLLANMLSDGGMGAALIRERNPDRRLESTVYWLAVSIGLGLATMVSILAWPISILYRQPGLFAVLLVLAPILVVSSSLAVANARIIRAQRFAVFAVGDVASAILSAAVGLVLAFHGAGIWSLVAQQLVFWATKAAWVTWVAGFRPDFAVHFTSARPLVRFSANNLAANIADFAGKNAPVLIVGGMLGPASVARFAMSYQLARVAETVVSDPVNLATFSAVSAAAGGHEAREFVVTALRVLTLVLLPLFCGLALTASLLTPLVLGERWIGTGPALAALAPGALALCLYKFATAVLLGKGRSGRTFRLTLLTGTAISAATLLGVRFGVTWAVIGFSVGALSMAPFYLSSLARSLDVSSWTLLAAARTSFVATAVMAGAVLLVRSETAGLSGIVQLALAVTAGAAVFMATGFLLGGRQIRSDIQKLRRQPAKQTFEPWTFMPPAVDDNPSPLETTL